VQLSFASGSLRQYLNISYKGKLESTALEADDIEKKLYEFIPSGNGSLSSLILIVSCHWLIDF
jgi:hypothetical protein